MIDNIEERIIQEANYIIESNATVRETAKVFEVSKSTIHRDIDCCLKKINRELYFKAKAVLLKNKAERALRGGMAIAKRYRELKERECYER